MAKEYKVKSPVRYQGRLYGIGESISMDETDAKGVEACLESPTQAPAKPPKKGKANAKKAASAD